MSTTTNARTTVISMVTVTTANVCVMTIGRVLHVRHYSVASLTAPVQGCVHQVSELVGECVGK